MGLAEVLTSFQKDEALPIVDGDCLVQHCVEFIKDADDIPQGIFFMIFKSDVVALYEFTPDSVLIVSLTELSGMCYELPQVHYAQLMKPTFGFLTATRHPKSEKFLYNSKMLEGRFQKPNLTAFFETNPKGYVSLMKKVSLRKS